MGRRRADDTAKLKVRVLVGENFDGTPYLETRIERDGESETTDDAYEDGMMTGEELAQLLIAIGIDVIYEHIGTVMDASPKTLHLAKGKEQD